MKNFKKICQVLLLAAICCVYSQFSLAVTLQECDRTCASQKDGHCVQTSPGDANSYVCMAGKNVEPAEGAGVKAANDMEEYYKQQKNIVPAGGNGPQDQGAVTGCSANTGLFSGLIQTGSEIFKGLRDLIYVVAGFGIIGVAVGGFFGNLNWKWLGAILIALVVIASTGEIINMITGCENFTSGMITDTLK